RPLSYEDPPPLVRQSQIAGPLSAAVTPAAVFFHPAVAMASAAAADGNSAVIHNPRAPPPTRHGRARGGSRRRRATKGASSRRSVSEYSHTFSTISSLNEARAKRLYTVLEASTAAQGTPVRSRVRVSQFGSWPSSART